MKDVCVHYDCITGRLGLDGYEEKTIDGTWCMQAPTCCVCGGPIEQQRVNTTLATGSLPNGNALRLFDDRVKDAVSKLVTA